ncbi:family 14 glycosylhydrolase [Cellulosilyticum ruminicola]|nr:family 14 glycosylhydrolase [Cellulosilyticum ruminicola]
MVLKIFKSMGCKVISLAIAVGMLMPVTTFAETTHFTANAMAPLKVINWNEFNNQLRKAKEIGIDAISVDVWWGDVEGVADNQFDFSYYDRVFAAIKAADLDIVPIMSFHQCGGNVGDNYTAYLPRWIWTKYENTSIEGQYLNRYNLKYQSSQGNFCNEYISLWADEAIKNEYIDFMNAFEDHFGATYKNDIQELNISGGPAGELRYPSYNNHDTNTGYPNKGAMQCYSNLAKADFRVAMLTKYGSLQSINNAWGCNLSSLNQVTPPMDGDNFFYSNGAHNYYESQYGKDLLEWYNGSLVEHGRRMLTYGQEAFDEDFDNIKLGIKIPGVHWQMESTNTPRAAEVCAGVIDSDFSQDNGYGYNPILEMIESFNDEVNLHFTCLEMNDHDGNNTSAPKTLVGYVGDSAARLGIEIKGENALSGGDDYQYYWNNISDAINYHGYNGITILRVGDVVEGQSYNYYRDFIARYEKEDNNQINVSVKFRVNQAETYWGQNVYVVGNIKELGKWNTDQAVKLGPTNYPTWEGIVTGIPANSSFEFKFIKKDGYGVVIWESGNNHVYYTNDHDGNYISNWLN